jgi:hypothetical protein
MINHEVEIVDTSHKTPSGDERLASVASILVKPPITPGEYFKNAIIGVDGHGVSLHHIETTSEVTLFLAGRWREIRACNGNVCRESKRQNSHDSLLNLTFWIATTDPKVPIY